MRARRVGRHGLLVECADAEEVAGTYTVLRQRSAELGATEIVPAARTVLLDGLADASATAELIAAWAPGPASTGAPAAAGQARVVEITVTYDGPDLADVARQWDVDTAEVVAIHRATEFRVAFCGFAPGFAYCTGLPAERAVRRRAEPRAKVPPGSVALAGEFTGIYPSASPGGWQIIGTTTAAVWRPEQEQPALLEPGTRVRFRDAWSLGSPPQGLPRA